MFEVLLPISFLTCIISPASVVPSSFVVHIIIRTCTCMWTSLCVNDCYCPIHLAFFFPEMTVHAFLLLIQLYVIDSKTDSGSSG